MSDPVLKIGEVEVCPYLLQDLSYPSGPYLLKNFKTSVTNPRFHDNKIFDKSVDSGRVVIEHAFWTLKNQWRILKNFNMNMDRTATVTLECCVFHNFCEIASKWSPLPENVAQRPDPFVGVRRGAMRLSDYGRAGNVAGK